MLHSYYDIPVRGVWLKNGLLHRSELPAITQDGILEWYKNDQRHRKDGPAIIDGDMKHWYLYGQHSRENGLPHVEAYGRKYWLVNGKFVE